MASRIKQVSIGSGGWTTIEVPIACRHATLRIPLDAAASVDIRDDSSDATTEDTLTPGESYRQPRRTGGFLQHATLIYAKAQSGTVTGRVHCTDDY